MACADHRWEPGRKEGDFKCSICPARFPCKGNTCCHLDCVEQRGKLPACVFCNKIVSGPPGGFRVPNSVIKALASEEDGDWSSFSIYGSTRAAHYVCMEKKNGK